MKKIIINDQPWQTRIAITHNGRLQNLYLAAHSNSSLERCYFKGVIIKILPGIQTAFVDIGQAKAGFLHISEIDRELAIDRIGKTAQLDDEDTPPRTRVPRSQLDITKIFKEGENVLVQVSKEAVYEKGPKLTTCFTMPGRFLVLMPNIPRIGVSKKIDDKDERIRLKKAIADHLPEGCGAIIRTTAAGREEHEILEDLRYLITVWQDIQKKYAAAPVRTKIHEDLDLPLQIVRDHLGADIELVVTDSKESQHALIQFAKQIAPEYSHKVQLYPHARNIFAYYEIEKQIDEALDRKVSLKSGGSLVIETTEAMSVVDVNSGRFASKGTFEDTILKVNLEAAEEVVRQLVLRNIGGLIVIDFIDMTVPANKQKLFRHFEKILRDLDRFQSVVLKISELGIVEMTRKRSGKTLQQMLTEICVSCCGTGMIRSLQTESFAILRTLQDELAMKKKIGAVTVHIADKVFDFLNIHEYNALLMLEKNYGCRITLASNADLKNDEFEIEVKNA